MLVSDKYGFIVATPTKNGTTSLQAMAQSWVKGGGSQRVLRVFRGASETKHRMAPPEECYGYARHIVVRDVNTRLPSMYEWLRRRPNDEHIGAACLDWERVHGREEGWAYFIRLYTSIRDADGYRAGGRRRLGARRPYMWTDNQSELWDFLAGWDADGSELPWLRAGGDPDVLRTESLVADWQSLLAGYGVEEDALFDAPVKQLNSTQVGQRLCDSAGGYAALAQRLGAGSEYAELLATDAREFGV